MATTEHVTFPGAHGETLDGRLERPAGTPRAFAIFAHCFTCSKSSIAASRISRQLTQHGLAVLRFDFTGLGGSGGDFASTNFSSNVGDIVKAADYLATEHAAPALLIGHSLGGAAVIVAAGQIDSVKAVATLAAPATAGHVVDALKLDRGAVNAQGEGRAQLGEREITITRQFLEDVDGQNVEAAARALRRPLLIAHSPNDEIVGIDNATRLFVAARHPKSFVSLDDADHLISDKRDACFAANVIAAWADRYLAPGAPGREPPQPDAQGGVIVAETGRGRYENQVVAGDHVLLADEPERVGGGDRGPSPYEYLLAALGACTSMTMRMYAERKSWPLDRVSVTLHHRKGHAEDTDARVAEGRDRKVDIIDRTIAIEGELDADQRDRLMEIADKCPVHRTLNDPVVIRTRRAGEADAG